FMVLTGEAPYQRALAIQALVVDALRQGAASPSEAHFPNADRCMPSGQTRLIPRLRNRSPRWLVDKPGHFVQSICRYIGRGRLPLKARNRGLPPGIATSLRAGAQ